MTCGFVATPPDPGRPTIRVLSDDLVDQIAAGEVVERPASVAKELVENALDARAGRIRLEVRDGGLALVAVSDDGIGMSADEARLALRRHATSKLERSEDLAAIRSYGFRGEALPAIASVSTLRLRSRPRGAAEGVEIRVEGGVVVDARPAGGPEGTRIEVSDLFARVPARRKFLKSPQTEWGHVADWAARVALARPRLHLELVRDDRPALVWPATSDPLARVAAVLSEADAAAMVRSEREAGAATLHALVSRPDRHRPTAEGLYLFVNGRPVRDRLLRHALLEPYRDVLPRGRFPTAVLFLELSPGSVDVNVHPAKWEVRFADPRTIHHLVSSTVRDALGARSWLRGGVPEPLSPGWRAVPAQTGGGEGEGSDWALARPGDAAADPMPQRIAEGLFETREPTPGLRFSELRLLGQLRCTYLVLESPAGLLLVDQHAAHERVLYEKLRDAWRERGVVRQPLLLAATVTMDPASHAALVAREHEVADLGFEVEPFGESTVVVRAIPALLAGRDPADLVRSLADELAEAERSSGSTAAGVRSIVPADHLLATLACHSARRKGEALDPREQRALLEALDEIPFAPCCPHGRPVAVPFDLAEIERRFGRR
ncbi:DNA mismatch repair protein MutL [Myxococcaceae bacterium]|nr:DNA mismatch repair protein MutL [Myxococcaceae bacterium]